MFSPLLEPLRIRGRSVEDVLYIVMHSSRLLGSALDSVNNGRPILLVHLHRGIGTLGDSADGSWFG